MEDGCQFDITSRPTMDLFAKRVLAVAMKGEQERGNGGVVLCNRDDDTIAYVLCDEISTEELRDSVREMLSDEGERFYYVVEETDRKMHIWKIDKAAVMNSPA